MLELLTTCPRALEYNKLHARVAASDKPSLNFGSACHIALEYRYLHYGSNAVDIDCLQGQSALLEAFFNQHPVPIDDWRTLNWAIDVISHYNTIYMAEPFNLLRYDKPIACPNCNGIGRFDTGNCLLCRGTGKREVMIELPFTLKLYDRGPIKVMYCGRIDLPVVAEGSLFVIDHKTTSMLGSTFFERAAMMAQQLGYCWAFNQLTGRIVNGYIINALRTKEPPQYITQGGAEAKVAQITKWWQESFQRERFYVDAKKLAEWHFNTIDLVEEFFWHYERGYMPMKTAWCCQFGRCQYYDVCTLPSNDRGLMLSSGNYTDNTWSPLKTPSQSKQ